MTFKLGKKSRERLIGVHPDLIRVVERAIELTDVDFTVLEGIRSKSRQEKLVASGASQTMNSRHLTGHAVDLVLWSPVKSDGTGAFICGLLGPFALRPWSWASRFAGEARGAF